VESGDAVNGLRKKKRTASVDAGETQEHIARLEGVLQQQLSHAIVELDEIRTDLESEFIGCRKPSSRDDQDRGGLEAGSTFPPPA
jgi:hypothetical protein